MSKASSSNEMSWATVMGEGGAGTGNWKFFPREHLPRLFDAAEQWKQQLHQVEKPWLCWCVDEEWCWHQQRLVASVGWTPIVGTDGRFARPRLHESAVFVDFNEHLGMPLMWMHFPLEFMHLFCERLAFWHSDVLMPVARLREVARQFENTQQGEVVAVDMTRVGIGTAIRRYLRGRQPFFRRYFEVLACTTATASRSQFETGCSWWRHPALHPNFQADVIHRKPHFDHGVGIWLWKHYFNGVVHPVEIDVHQDHYSTNHPLYRRQRDAAGKPLGSKHREITESFDLAAIAVSLGLPVDERDQLTDNE